MAEPRRTFGPVVLAGVAAAGLAALAGTRPWAEVEGSSATSLAGALSTGGGEVPLAGALALVVLASWGVLLVTRGRVRRAVSIFAGLVALALSVTVLLGGLQVADTLRDELALVALVDTEVSGTWWFPVALVAALLCVLTTALAVLWAPSWPEMGTKYDAPTGASTGSSNGPANGPAGDAPDAPEERSSLDLWKAMDEGEDPTA